MIQRPIGAGAAHPIGAGAAHPITARAPSARGACTARPTVVNSLIIVGLLSAMGLSMWLFGCKCTTTFMEQVNSSATLTRTSECAKVEDAVNKATSFSSSAADSHTAASAVTTTSSSSSSTKNIGPSPSYSTEANCMGLASIFGIDVPDDTPCDAALHHYLDTSYQMGHQPITFAEGTHAFNVSIRVDAKDRVLSTDSDLLEMALHFYKKESSVSLEDKVFFDVGMNLGLFTLGARKIGFKHVYSFEPQPLCHVLVKDSLRINGFLESPHHKMILTALGDPVETQSFVPNLYQCGQGFRVPDAKSRIQTTSGKPLAKFTTPITPLSSYISKVPQVFFFKMDTEGYETMILPDVLPYFQSGKIKHFVVEISPKFWKSSVSQGIELFVAIHKAAKKTFVKKMEGLNKCSHGTVQSNELIAGKQIRLVEDIAATLNQLATDPERANPHCDFFFFF